MKFIPELHAITLKLFSRNLVLEFLMVIKPLAPAPQIKDAPHTDSHPHIKMHFMQSHTTCYRFGPPRMPICL